ncbi:MAG TPA: hypothetical protein VGM84_17520 [Steroidobacteraceae bacterium]|jgi:hypothetical protein
MPAVTNPYIPPKAHIEDFAATDSDAEVVRREHIQVETSIRSFGLPCYLFGCFPAICGILLLIAHLQHDATLLDLGKGAILMASAALMFATGRGISRLRPWARNIVVVLALIGIPSLITVYALYLLLSKEGRRVFEPDYAYIVADTPEVKTYRTSPITWVALAVLLLVIAGLFVFN